MNKNKVDGYISEIMLNGKTYALKCKVIEVHPMTCPHCGGNVVLKYGNGKCEYCGTMFATDFKIVEV